MLSKRTFADDWQNNRPLFFSSQKTSNLDLILKQLEGKVSPAMIDCLKAIADQMQQAQAELNPFKGKHEEVVSKLAFFSAWQQELVGLLSGYLDEPSQPAKLLLDLINSFVARKNYVSYSAIFNDHFTEAAETGNNDPEKLCGYLAKITAMFIKNATNQTLNKLREPAKLPNFFAIYAEGSSSSSNTSSGRSCTPTEDNPTSSPERPSTPMKVAKRSRMARFDLVPDCPVKLQF